VRAYVGLGSNLGDREAMLNAALERLDGVVAVSSFRETEPWGLAGQPPFLNAAAALETDLDPRALLDRLLAIERELGLYGDLRLDEPGLTVPHPRLHERAFALEPLLELDPGLVVPGKGAVNALLAALD
jgi:2-amino-4-hydroxy-6-hydroxymethyldihydropteridine diphosphokinase